MDSHIKVKVNQPNISLKRPQKNYFSILLAWDKLFISSHIFDFIAEIIYIKKWARKTLFLSEQIVLWIKNSKLFIIILNILL